MPIFNARSPVFRPKNPLEADWNNFRKGLNLLLRPTELGTDEYAQGDNVILDGSGTVKGRWGTAKYFTVNATGIVRGIGTYLSTDGTVNQIFGLSDEGFLAKRNNSSSTVIEGVSYPSGSVIRTEQLGNKTHIVSKDSAFVSYDGTNVEIFATISPPTGLTATNFSGASGPDRVSYKVTTIGSNGGETTASDNYILEEVPIDLSDTEIRLQWTAPSAATLGGYQIYRGLEGDETLLAAVGPQTTNYTDRGDSASETVSPPLSNTTGGVESEFIVKYKDRLIVVDSTDPNKVLISGRFPNHTKFSWINGGGYIYVDPDSGDNITGLVVQPITDRIVVYKNGASYLLELSTVTIGNFVVLDPSYIPISTAVGCSAQDSVATVENDSFYFGRDGIYVTGYEPNFLNIIRTNEVSVKLRPYFAEFGSQDFENANAAYFDNKYILSIPTRKEMVVYDRERGAFVGIWKLPFGISFMRRYFDESGTERWVIGSYENNQIYTFEQSLNTDDGVAISKTFRTGKEDFGDWTRLSIIRFFYVLFRAITGEATVNILVENRAGITTNVKTFTITGAEVAGRTGWGINLWGGEKWGQSKGSFQAAGSEITRWGSLFKQSRLVQVEVITNSAQSNFELLSIKLTANPQTEGSLSSGQRV